jgi:hypothetical protein
MGGADRRGEAGFRAEHIAAGDKGEILGAAGQRVDEVGDQLLEPTVFADQADQRFAGHGFLRGKDGGFHTEHPFAPAGGWRIENFPSDQRNGPPPVQPNGDDHVDRPKARISSPAAGAFGAAEHVKAAAFAAAETGSASRAQAFRLVARPFESTAKSSRAPASQIRAWVEAARPAGAIAPERHEGRGPERVPTAKRRSRGVASSALMRRFLRKSGALQPQERAERAGGGRVGAQGRVGQSERGVG